MKHFSYNGAQYKDHPNTVNDHYQTTLGDIGNRILAVGSYDPKDSIDNNNKVELFDITKNAWETKSSFPFCSSK